MLSCSGPCLQCHQTAITQISGFTIAPQATAIFLEHSTQHPSSPLEDRVDPSSPTMLSTTHSQQKFSSPATTISTRAAHI